MTESERKLALERIARAREATRTMSREQARRRLVEEGFYNENGRLSVNYGGKAYAPG
jgi:hypothetical protein